MANRRMFAKSIIRTDTFLDMPQSAQNLYFHLGIEADDDGFVSPKVVMRMLGSPDDDLKLLIAKKFVIPFEDGVLVIVHWKVHNEIRQDRYKPTLYQEKIKQIKLNQGVYTLGTTSGTTACHPRIGEDRIEKDRIEEIPANAGEVFSLKEEIHKLENSPRRDLNIIAMYFEERKPNIQNYQQFQVALKRHLRDAKDLVPFTDNQILDAVPKANKLTSDWTIGTLIKILTK